MTDDWRHGYSKQMLKNTADPWKKAQSQYAHGPFGQVKEREIADAIFKKQYLESNYNACIWQQYKVKAAIADFSGRLAQADVGDVMLKHVLLRGDINELVAQLPESKRVWVEIFEEDTATRSLLEAADFKWVLTKVSSYSDIRGIYCRGAEAPVWRQRPEDALCLEMLKKNFAPKAEHENVLAELEYVEWQDHYSNYNIKDSWSAFALQGFRSDPTYIIKPSEMSKKWKTEHAAELELVDVQPTNIAKHFPAAMRLADLIPGKKERIRFMRLKANSSLGRHTDTGDKDSGICVGRVARLHIPIITNDQCLFNSWSQRGEKIERNLPVRSLSYLDTRKPHAVSNTSTVDRVHLVVDTWGSKELVDFVMGQK